MEYIESDIFLHCIDIVTEWTSKNSLRKFFLVIFPHDGLLLFVSNLHSIGQIFYILIVLQNLKRDIMLLIKLRF